MKRGGQVVGSLLRNWEAVDKAMENMENSAGSADREMSKIEQGWDYKLNKLGETWTGVLQEMLDRKGFASILDMIQGISDAASGLTDTFGGLSTAAAGLFGALAVKGSSPFLSYNMKQDQWSGAFPNIKESFANRAETKLFKGLTKEDIAAFDKIKQSIEAGNPKFVACKQNLQGCSQSAKILAGEFVAGKRSLDSISSGFENVNKTSKLASFGMKAFSVAANMALGIGIGLLINGIISAFDHLINSTKYAEEEVDKFSQKTKEFNDTQKEQREWIDKNAERLSELSKGVSELGDNLSLTDEEYKEYIDLSNQAGDMFPGLIKHWDEMGNKIIETAEGIKGFNDEYERTERIADAGKNEDYDEFNEEFWNGETDNGTSRESLYTEGRDLYNYLNNGGRLSSSFNNIIEDFLKDQEESVQLLWKDMVTDGVDTLEGATKYLDSEQFLQHAKDRGYTEDQISQLRDKLTNMIPNLIQRLQTRNQEINQELEKSEDAINLISDRVSSAKVQARNIGLDEDQVSKVGEAVQNIPNQMIRNIFDNGYDDKYGNEAVDQWIKDKIIIPVQKGIDDAEFPGLINKLFTTEPNGPYEDYLITIQDTIKALKNIEGVDEASLNNILSILGLGSYDDKTGTLSGVSILEEAKGKYKNLANGLDVDNYISSLSKAELQYINQDDVANSIHTFEQLKSAISDFRGETDSTNASTKTFKQLWKELGGKDTKAARKELLEMAKGGTLTTEAFEKFKKGKYAKMFEDIGMSAEEAVNKINKLAQGVDQLSSMKTGISAILSTYDEKRDSKDHRVGADTISSLGSTLGVEKWTNKKDKKVWDDYQKTAASSTTTLKELKAAQDALATSYVNNENFLANLDEEHKQYYQDLLTEMGVTNSEEVVTNSLKNKQYELARAKAEAAVASSDLIDVTVLTTERINAEAEQLGLTGQAANWYRAEIIKASNATIYTDGSISNLKSFARALGITGKNAAEYAKIIWQIQQIQSGKAPAGAGAQLESLQRRAKALEDGANKVKVTTKTNGGSVDDKIDKSSSSSDKDKTKNKQYIDWIERRITRINNVISNISARIENIGKWGQKIGKGTFDWLDKFKNIKNVDKRDDKRVQLTVKALKEELKYYNALARMEQLASKKYNRKANEVVNSKAGKKVFKGKQGTLMLRRIKSPNFSKKDFRKSTWYQQLSDNQKEVVDSVIDFFDKGKAANQEKQNAISSARTAKTQIYQTRQDRADTRKSRVEAREAITTGYKGQNKQVDIQIQEMQKSYKQQIKIAKLEGNMAEAERLQYEMKKERSELLLHEFENIQNDFDRLRGRNERRVQDAQNLIDVAEAEGRRVSANWYGVQNIQYRKEYDSYKKQYDAYLAQLEKINSGQMTADNLEEVMNKIQEAQNGMAESLTKTAENLTKIRELEDSIYDEIRNNNNEVYEDTQFLTSMYREDSINTRDRDNGYYKFSEAGLARMSTANVGIGVANSNADMDAKQYNRYRNLYDTVSAITDEKERQQKLEEAGFSSMEQLLEQQKKYKKAWQDDIKARQEAENQMIDLMKEYYEGQKTYLGELIDARKKLLDEEKELYDYEKNINEKTKNIATLQKRLVALRGDTSEEGRARRRQIENQLDQAQQDLQDTEYERWKTDQENMLTNLQEQFNDIVDQHLKYPDQLLEESKQLLTDNKTTLTNIGTHLTTELTQANMQSAFETALGTITMPSTSLIEEKLGTVNEYLLAIANKVEADYKGAKNGLNTNDGSGGNGNGKGDISGNDPNTITTTSNIKDIINKNHVDNLGKNNVDNHGLLAKDPETRTLVDALKTYGSSDGDKTNALNKALIKFSKEVMNETLMLPNNSKYKKFASYISEQLGTASLLDKDGKADWTKNSKLYKKLKSYGLSGFKTGGIGTLVKASGEDGLAMVRNGEGFVAPEHVQSIQQLLKVTPDLTQVMSNKNNTSQTTIDTLRLELPNVQDVRGFVEEFQTNKEVQRIFSIGVNDLLKTGHLTSNIHRL